MQKHSTTEADHYLPEAERNAFSPPMHASTTFRSIQDFDLWLSRQRMVEWSVARHHAVPSAHKGAYTILLLSCATGTDVSGAPQTGAATGPVCKDGNDCAHVRKATCGLASGPVVLLSSVCPFPPVVRLTRTGPAWVCIHSMQQQQTQ